MLKNYLIWILLTPIIIIAQTYPAKPGSYVIDETGTLNSSEQSALNAKLKAFEDSSSNQIFVYIALSLGGRDIEGYAQEIFHNWKIGKADKNNGVLIAIFINEHKFRIQTGYGLEGVLPDLLTKGIQDEIMRPRFKEKDYYKGIDQGINELIFYSKHEFVADDYFPGNELPSYWQNWTIGYAANLVFLIWYCYNVLRKSSKRKKQTSSFTKFVFIVIAVVAALIPCFGGIVLFFMVIASSNIKFSAGAGNNSDDTSSSWSSSDSSLASGSSDSGSCFDGGGGGDSGGGGSSSDW